MDVLIRLVVCVAAVYVLVYLAGLYDDFMRWRDQRRLLKHWRSRYGRE